MSAFQIDERTKFQISRGEIDGWRGQCLDLYARSECAIAQTLEHAHSHGRSVKLRHLAGQRLADLQALISAEAATPRQAKALDKALSEWHEVERNRVFIAHGVLQGLIGGQREWWAIFDVRVYDKTGGTNRRWALSNDEANAFHSRLLTAFEALSSQLGQLRRMLRP